MQATTARKPMRRFGPEAGVLLTSSRMRDVDSAGVRLMFPPWNLRPAPGRRAQSRSGVCAVGMGRFPKDSIDQRRRHVRSLSLRKHRIVRSYRSEEHTSELQSRGHLVCRLLLEKKNADRTGVRMIAAS